MINYEITVYINDDECTEVVLPVTYEKEYDLRRDITNMGISGVLQKDEDNNFLYYPSHRINKIVVEKVWP